MPVPVWSREEVLFDEALALPASQRAAFLEIACAGDTNLRWKVEDLLNDYEQAHVFFESLAGSVLEPVWKVGVMSEGLATHEGQPVVERGSEGEESPLSRPNTELVRRLFEEMVSLDSRTRDVHLSRVDDIRVRQEVERLLAAATEDDRFLVPIETVFPGSPSPVDDPLIGTTVSHYQIDSRLGGGGMGLVYRAHDVKLDRTVALKFLPPGLTRDEEARRRFMQEARTASALQHPNVCTIHEIDETTDGQTFIAMAYYEGETLKEKIARGQLSFTETMDYARQMADGLAAAHLKGIIHRDIKPANVLITPEGRVILLDFGIAKLSDVDLTTTGATLGTVAYMSPEQARSERVDAQTDLWSLGVVLYEMLTGVRPFRGEHPEMLLYAIRHQRPDPVSAHRPDVPEQLERIVERLLQKDPAERYPDALTLRADLLGNREYSDSTTKRLTSGFHERRRLVMGLFAVVVLLVTGFGYYLFQVGQPSREAIGSMLDIRPMIVVLPLENLGPSEVAYFAAGMTEEITSRLASVRALGVIARSSARQYAATEKSLQQIGEELGVEYVLEGTVRWVGDAVGSGRVRITPHLARVSDGTTIWSRTYEREMADVFAIQAEIAEAVVEQLGVQLLEPEREAVEKQPTENLEAYHAYLQAQYYVWGILDLYQPEIWEQAASYFQQAVTLDPGFVAAYAGLARAHASMIHFGFDASEERHQKARAALDLAMALDPEHPQVRLSVGQYHYFVHRDYDRALEAFELAEQDLPREPELLVIKGFMLRRQNRWDSALMTLEKALQLNPRDPRASGGLGDTYKLMHRYPEAIQTQDRTIALAPDEYTGYLHKAGAYWAWTGDLDESRTVLEAIPAARQNYTAVVTAWFLQELFEGRYREALQWLSAPNPDSASTLPGWKHLLAGVAYTLLEEPAQARSTYEEARSLLEKELEGHPEDLRRYPMLRASLGLAYAGLGRKAEAIREGEAAVAHVPVSKDAVMAENLLRDLALIYTRVGEYDDALDQIETLLAMPSHLSVQLLQIDPRWAPLRSHPRFQDLTSNTKSS